MRGFYMDEAFTGSPSDLQHISHDTNFTAKQWVDNTSASLAPIEATSTASQPYTVGKRLVYGGRLYKVTQAIAQGGTLTPGTNITPDTVDEELSTISTHLTQTESDVTNMKKADIGTNVVIWNGTGSAPSSYVAPSDGYLWAYIASDNKYMSFRISGQMPTSFSRNASIPSDASPVFIRKGTTITNIATNDTSSNSSLQFFPLV